MGGKQKHQKLGWFMTLLYPHQIIIKTPRIFKFWAHPKSQILDVFHRPSVPESGGQWRSEKGGWVPSKAGSSVFLGSEVPGAFKRYQLYYRTKFLGTATSKSRDGEITSGDVVIIHRKMGISSYFIVETWENDTEHDEILGSDQPSGDFYGLRMTCLMNDQEIWLSSRLSWHQAPSE